MKKISFLILAFFCLNKSLGQNFEQYLTNLDVDNESIQLYTDQLTELYNSPLDINKTDFKELILLNILSEAQALEISEYRSQNGPIMSVYELQILPSIDKTTYDKILPFIKVNKQTIEIIKIKENKTTGYSLLRSSMSFNQKNNGSNIGNSSNLLFKTKIQRNDGFRLGITFEKDTYEPLFFKKEPIFFYSGFIQYKPDSGPISNVIIGDYKIQFGQGLMLSGGFNQGKGVEPVNTIFNSKNVALPYSSTLENNFMRGLYITLSKRKFSYSFFLSGLSNHARLNELNPDNYISINNSGLFRTVSEIATKNTLLEKSLGSMINFNQSPKLKIGLTVMYLNRNLKHSPDFNSYNQFKINEQNNLSSSLSFQSTLSNTTMFGEFVVNSGFHKAGIIGIIQSFKPKLDFSLVYRNYGKSYHSSFANALSESSEIANESGLYLGIKFYINQNHQILFYYDIFKFPWLKYQLDIPGSGDELSIRYKGELTDKTSLTIGLKSEKRTSTSNDGKNINVTNAENSKFLLALIHKPSKVFETKSTINFNKTKVAGQESSGFGISQDLKLSMGNTKLTFRYALIDSRSFESRIYMYENDVLYAGSFPFYYGVGKVVYLVAKQKIFKGFDLWIKIRRGLKQQQNENLFRLSSTNWSARMQLMYKF